MATHGLGRLAYKQLVAVSRAAEEQGQRTADARGGSDARDGAEAVDAPQDLGPDPAQRADVPPGSWVAAFPAPDPEPLPSPVAWEPPVRAAPRQEAAAPPPREAPEPVVEQRFEQRYVEAPAQVAAPAPEPVAPGAWDGEGAQVVVQPSPPPPTVTVVVVNPVVAGYVYGSPRAPAPPQLAGRPTIHPGGRFGASFLGRR